MNSIDLIITNARRPLVLKLISAIFILFIILDLISGIGLFSRLNHDAKLRIASDKNQKIDMPDSNLQLGPNQSLFGEYVPVNIDDAGVRQSMLDLKVVGVLFASNEDDSEVLLQKPDGQEQFFRVGDKLSDGSVIKRITTEGVLVLRAGALERLSLPKEELQFSTSGAKLSLGDED